MLNLVNKISPAARALRPPVLGSTLLLFLVPCAGPVMAHAEEETVWLRIEVRSDDQPQVKIRVPISLIEVMVDSVDKREFLRHLEAGHHSLDISRIWHEVRHMDLEEFVTVESEDESLRVWKDREFLRVDASGSRAHGTVAVKIPLDLLDYLFDAEGSEFSFQEMIERIRDHLPLVMVEVESDEESVKIWLEEEE